MEHRYAAIAIRLTGLLILCLGIGDTASTIYVMVQWEPAGWWRLFNYIGGPFMLVLGLVLLFAYRPIARRLIKGISGCCPACGYDLRGTTENRCPECGSENK